MKQPKSKGDKRKVAAAKAQARAADRSGYTCHRCGWWVKRGNLCRRCERESYRPPAA